MKQISNILIIRLSSIGDIILTTALVRVLRNNYPDAKISYLVKKQFNDLLVHNPNIDQIILLDTENESLKDLGKRIRAEKFDWIIDLHNNFRSNYIKICSGASYKSSYSKKILSRLMLVGLGLNFYKNIKPVYLRYFEAVEQAGVMYDHSGTEVFFRDENKDKVTATLIDEGWDQQVPIAVLCPGSKHFTKQWLPERFALLAGWLTKKKGYCVVLAGAGDEYPLCENIKIESGVHVINLAGKFSLLQTACLLRMANLCVVNDSGLLHLAQSQKTPVVAIFGSTTRELGFFPLMNSSIVVEKELSCRPCSHIGRSKCPKGHFKCMKEIQLQDVTNAIEHLADA